jgi:phytoene dehydrogenase-like protein
MTEEYDVVIIGGGHNGLIVGCYLARAGQNVCVVEKQDMVGGGVVTREVTIPGFKHDLAAVSHTFIQRNPLIEQDELNLQSKYGLKYVPIDPVQSILFSDDRALIIYQDIDKTCESIAQFSHSDAERYRQYCKTAQQILKVAGMASFSPPPSFGKLLSFLDASEDGREYIRSLFSCYLHLAEEYFESEQMRVALCRYASEHMISPRDQGGGIHVFGFYTVLKHVVPIGGSGALSEALAACLRDFGGTIKLSSTVNSVKIQHGEAQGVVLENNKEILARKAVISNLNVKQLFLDLLPPEQLPQGFQARVRHLRHGYSCILQSIALNQAPTFKAGGDVNKSVMLELTPFTQELLRIFDDLAYGIPRNEISFLCIPTLVDPTRAPDGKHTLYLYHYEPYDLMDGGAAKWDEIKQDIADGILNVAKKHITNLGPENILARHIMSPLDFEKYNPSFVKGDILHIRTFAHELFSNRPLPGWGQYRTPIKKLYMCGASTHPGGGVTGGGRAAVQAIMEDLGLDFQKTTARR